MIDKLIFSPINNLFFKNKENRDEIIGAVRRVLEDKQRGTNITIAGVCFYGLVYLFLLGIINSILILFKEIGITITINVHYKYLLLTLGIISYVCSYFIIDHKDKYLEYFDEFEMLAKDEKIKWGWISFVMIILLFGFGFGSLLFRLTL
ncbi:MAG: hypothetical protein QM631_04530 [Dysgonomonas sp.]